jgi:hypothetical protein
MMGDGEFGWGDTETAPGHGAVSVAVLVVASGLYCASLWLVSGMQPLTYLAARVRGRRQQPPRPAFLTSEGAKGIR